jgi:hypothetical protein
MKKFLCKFAIGLSISVLAVPSFGCPSGLTPTTGLYLSSGGAGDGDDQQADITVSLPYGAVIDPSYVESAADFGSPSWKAISTMTAGDIPHGFWAQASGSQGGASRWAIGLPSNGKIIGAVINYATLAIDHYTFTLHLYSDNGHCNLSCGGSNVKVEVCYKQKP